MRSAVARPACGGADRGTDHERDRTGGARPPGRRKRGVRPGAAGRGLRDERRVPACALGAEPSLGRRHPEDPEGVPGRRRAPAAAAAQSERTRAEPPGSDGGAPKRGSGAGRIALAPDGVAARDQGTALGVLRRGARAGGRRAPVNGWARPPLGEAAWLVWEERASDEVKYYLTSHPQCTSLLRRPGGMQVQARHRRPHPRRRRRRECRSRGSRGIPRVVQSRGSNSRTRPDRRAQVHRAVSGPPRAGRESGLLILPNRRTPCS